MRFEHKHFIIAANAGYKKSLDKVKGGYMHGLVTKDEYQTLTFLPKGPR